MNEFMGVIIAAGKGTRLYPITQNYPKSLIPIANKSIMEYQIELLKDVGITEILIVVGHYGFEVTKVLGDGRKYGVTIQYVEQKEAIGSANAVGITAKLINKPFLLILGDIYFKVNHENLKKMLKDFLTSDANGIIATKEVTDLQEIKENFAIQFQDDGKVIKVIEKPKKPINNIKGCGIYLFDDNIFEAINRTPRTALRDEYEFTDSIQKFIELNYNVYYKNVIEEDINLNYTYDLYQLNMKIVAEREGKNIIGLNLKKGAGVSITNSVIGNDVTIQDNVELVNCVLFNDVEVKKNQKLEQCIITKNSILRI